MYFECYFVSLTTLHGCVASKSGLQNITNGTISDNNIQIIISHVKENQAHVQVQIRSTNFWISITPE